MIKKDTYVNHLLILVAVMVTVINCDRSYDTVKETNSTSEGDSILVVNASFEANAMKSGQWDKIDGWRGKAGGTSGNGYFAPMDGGRIDL